MSNAGKDMTESNNIPPPWHESFPSPRNTETSAITREELLSLFRNDQQPGRDFLLVDLRRTDHEGGTITRSLNLPAQTLYPSLQTVLRLCQSAGIKLVIWYCGSSRGRGTRAANWFTDLLEDESVTDIKSVILEGGVKGWVKSGEEYIRFMDGFVAEAWNGGIEG